MCGYKVLNSMPSFYKKDISIIDGSCLYYGNKPDVFRKYSMVYFNYHNMKVSFIEMQYKSMQEIPEEYQNLIELLIERGIIVINNNEFEHPLNLDLLYLLKVIFRII